MGVLVSENRFFEASCLFAGMVQGWDSLKSVEIPHPVSELNEIQMFDLSGFDHGRITSYNVCYTKLLRNKKKKCKLYGKGEAREKGAESSIRL